jgi:hypothetical protein
MSASALKAYDLADSDAAARFFKTSAVLLAKPYGAYHREQGAANYHYRDAVSQFFALGPHCPPYILFSERR